MQFGNQTFRLPDIQTFLDDALGGEFLVFFVGKSENHFRMADGNPSFADKFLNRVRQFYQPQRIRDGGAALADFSGDFFLRELKLFRQLRVAVSLFNRIEIFALKIFDERQFQNRAVIGFARDDGNFRQVQKLRCAPAAFARDQFKKIRRVRGR